MPQSQRQSARVYRCVRQPHHTVDRPTDSLIAGMFHDTLSTWPMLLFQRVQGHQSRAGNHRHDGDLPASC